MKKSFLKLFIVVLLPGLLLLWLEINLSRVPNSFTEKRSIFQKNASQTKTVFLGSSQALYGIIPELISADAINLASLNQDLYYDHQWLFNYIDSMPQLKKVYFTFTYFTLGYELINTKEQWRAYFYERVWKLPSALPLNDIKKYSWISLYGPRVALSYARNGFKNEGEFVLSKNGFQSLDSTFTFFPSDSSGKAAIDYHHGFFRFPSIEDNKIRIFEMVQLCRDHNVEPILLLPPLHSTYRKYELDWIKGLNSVLIDNLREVKKIKVLDFSSHPAFTDNCFRDEFHLNHKGALLFSELVRRESNNSAQGE